MTAHKTLVKKEAESLAQYSVLLRQIRQAIAQGKARAADAVERELVRTKWETGKLILEHILLHQNRAAYDQEVIKRLAQDLRISATELSYMVAFARVYPIFPAPGKLSWSHYRELLAINDAAARESLAKTASREEWSLDETRRQIKKLKTAKQITVTPAAAPAKLIAKKGTPYTYRVVDFSALEKAPTAHLSEIILTPQASKRGSTDLKLDLGFSTYLSLSAADARKFKAGDIVESKPGQTPNSGLTRFSIALHASRLTLHDLFTYHARVLDVTDGDTVWVLVDLGFGIITKQCLRLRGLDAPEIATRDGQAAKVFLERALKVAAAERMPKSSRAVLGTPGPSILITSTKSDKYDRYLADIWAGDTFLNQQLIDRGLAVPVNE